MKELTQDEICCLSFDDSPIINMKISSREKDLIIEVDFAYIVYADGNVGLNNGILRFKNWKKFCAKINDNKDFEEMPFGILEPLEYIHVLSIHDSIALLGGPSCHSEGKYFDGMGKWIDYQIEGAEVSAMFEFEDP